MKIKQLTQADIAQIIAIENTIKPYPWPQASIEASFDSHYQAFGIFEQNCLIAYSVWHWVVDEATLMNVSVDSAHQGKGIATKLLSHVINNELPKLQVATIWLEVRESNHSAIHLYQGLGFELTGVRKNYYPCGSGRENAKVMRLVLKVI